jgi:hypothetical protein
VTRFRGTRALALLAAGMTVVSCGRPATTAAGLSWTLSPATPVVGPATLTVQLRDAGGTPLAGAQLRVDSFMSHPGMAPITAKASERTPGLYVVPVTFTMAGDWALLVSATLPDGGRVEQRIDVAVRSN